MKTPTIKRIEKDLKSHQVVTKAMEMQQDMEVYPVGWVAEFLCKRIKEILKYLAEKPPVYKAYQYFPRKDNPVRCRLCGEKVYCTCIEGWRERDLKLNLKIKKIEGKQK